MTGTKKGLTLLLLLVFSANFVETTAETWYQRNVRAGSELSYQVASAVHWLERNFSFEYHDQTNRIAVYGYSISYFFLFPLVGVMVAWTLARRADISGYRVFSLALAIDYAVSLPFFLFFPVPERWAYPETSAILLSDQWSSKLIEAVRPVSGLDNCFPSFHVSMTVIMIAVSYLFQVRLRTVLTAVGLTIILSTYVLGVHWLADIIGGLAAGVFSVSLAWRLGMRAGRERKPAVALAAPAGYPAVRAASSGA